MLFLLTKATHQPLTVALLGRGHHDVGAVGQRARSAAATAHHGAAAAARRARITAAALLAPHPLVADVVFVGVVFVAVYARRFGPRGRALGMVAFMSYFFTLYLRAKLSELPWLIGAVLVGTLCSFVRSAFVLPDRPESVLRDNIRALRARMAIVVDTTAETVRTGHLDERRRRRLRTAPPAQRDRADGAGQIEDRVNPACYGPVSAARTSPCGCSTPNSPSSGSRPRAEPRSPAPTYPPPRAPNWPTRWPCCRGQSGRRTPTAFGGPRTWPSSCSIGTRHLRRRAACAAWPWRSSTRPRDGRSPRTVERVAGLDAGEHRRRRRPPRRAATGPGCSRPPGKPFRWPSPRRWPSSIGETVSPSHWYWAAIAAFVIFAGTNSWAETLNKGWQRLLGTVLGVPAACWSPRWCPATPSSR